MDIAARMMSTVTGRNSSGPIPCSKNQSKVGMVVDVSDSAFIGGFIPSLIEKQKYPYSRPDFLFYSDDEISLASDHTIRPVICPKHPSRMPLYSGYAEVINAGKTIKNEDQASARMLILQQKGSEAETSNHVFESRKSDNSTKTDDDPLLTPGTNASEQSTESISRVEVAVLSIFDGHAGSSVAIVASKCLHEHVKSRLSEVLDAILNLDRVERMQFGKYRSESSYSMSKIAFEKRQIHSSDLVKGALETAFIDMDEQIAEDKKDWSLPGGCAVISIIVLLGKLYVANAGDCRAILVSSEGTRALSNDMTPATERKRLQEIAYREPELIGNSFSRLEYSRRLGIRDLKSKVLYRDWFMDGWAAKTVKESDLRPPLISDNCRKRRLLNTIGVSRGFGDHHLLTVDDKLSIKPFLSAVPEISVTNLCEMNTISDKDVVIVASDGLWDVLTNEDAGLIVRSTLGSTESSDASRYTLAAQELIIAARGYPQSTNSNKWLMSSGGTASFDDITVFVVPLKYCVAPPTNFEDDDDEMLSME